MPLLRKSISGGGDGSGTQDLKTSAATPSQYSQGTTALNAFEEIDLI